MITPATTYQLLAVLLGFVAALAVMAYFGRVPISYSVRNLFVRWRITFLTALAFTVVVCLLTVLLSFVNGMYKVTQASGQPGNVIVLSDGATDELFSNLGYKDADDVEQEPGVLKNAAGRPLCSKEVYLVVNQPIPSKPGERALRRFVQVRGVVDPVVSAEVHGLRLMEGQWFSDAGVQEIPGKPEAGKSVGEKDVNSGSAIQAVLGESVAGELGKDLGKGRLEIGDTFELGRRTWIVTGLMASRGSTFGSEIWAKKDLVGKQFGKDRYTTLVLRTGGSEEADTLARNLTTNFKKAALQAQTETAYYAKLSQTNEQFLYAIMFVAGVMALGGIFGVMNTMFAAIAQRTKDIGVLRILGFKRWQILTTFLLEALLLGILGGALGCALGYLANGFSATSVVSGGQGGGKTVVLELVVDGSILAVGMLFTLTMAFLGGLLPSLSAMRLTPLEAVR